MALGMCLVLEVVPRMGLAAMVRLLQQTLGLLVGLAKSVPMRLVPWWQVEALARMQVERMRYMLVGTLVRNWIPLVPGLPPRPIRCGTWLEQLRLLP
jgi:hypothetical protein